MRRSTCLFAVLVSACSAETPSGGAPIPIDQFASEYATAACTRIVSCSGRVRLYVGDVANCVSAYSVTGAWSSIAEMPVAALVQRVRSGALRYDPAAARECIEQVAPACDLNLHVGTPAACRRAFAGSVALGGPCVVSAECAGDAWCSTRDDRGGVCPGECTARSAADAPCSRSAECPISPSPDATIACTTVTRSTNGERRCLSVRLDPPSGLGQACGRRLVGAEEHAAFCAAGLWCQRGACAAPLAAGAACASEFDECAGGLCVGPLMGPKRCVAVTIQGSAGAPCHVNVSDLSEAQTMCDATLGLVCTRSTCAALTVSTAGQTCGTDTTRCAPGLVCTGLRGTCVLPGPAGAPCASNAACQSTACDAATGTCEAVACE